VALKVVKLGMDSRDVIAQFEAERQLLALMEHPNIAKVYDAGETEDGLPYFVMELVSGIPITRFCVERQLPTQERLRLFVQVCKALQHAHQKGVIHRDIKPSNILVSMNDGKPLAKVIDFGIAKAVHPAFADKQAWTAFEPMIGTPAYMSPEQVAGNIDIDTRCDIYALGVLLHELLVGRTPFDNSALVQAGPAKMRQILCGVNPPKPSSIFATLPKTAAAEQARQQQSSMGALTEALLSDLDWIVLKATQKDRNVRYETANGMAMDVERHLTHEPVVARPYCRTYRLKKLVNRNRLVYTVGTLLAVVLLTGISFTATQAMRAVKAEREHQNLRNMAEQSERKAQAEKEAARRALADAQIALADAAYRDQDGNAMQTALQAVPADLRKSSWRYLMEKSDTAVATISSPGGSVVEYALPHPAQAGVFITVAADHGVSIHRLGAETALLRFLLDFADRKTADLCVAVSPDGTSLAAAKLSGDHIAIHSLQDGSVMSRWESTSTTALAYSPDGRLLLEIIRDGPSHMRNARTGEILWSTITGETLLHAAFDSTGRNLVINKAVNGQKLQLLNAFNGELLRELGVPRTRLTALAISQDGRQALTGDQRGFVRCMDLKDGAVRYEFRANDRAITALAYTNAGKRIVTQASLSGGRQSIQVWDGQTGIFLQSLLNAGGNGRELAVHPLSGEIIATGVTAKVWRLKPLNEEFRLAARDFSNTCFWSNDELIFAMSTSASLDLLDLRLENAAAQPVWQSASKNTRFVTVSADGRMAAVAAPEKTATEIHLLRREQDQVIETKSLPSPDGLAFMHFNADGGKLLVRGINAFYVADATTGQRHDFTWDKTLTVREAVWVGATPRVVALLTARTARCQPGAEDRLMLFDAHSGHCLHTVANDSIINAVAVSPDGKLLAEGGTDHMVRLRDTQTLELKQELHTHDRPVLALAFHPTRAILATASEDLTIKLWNLADGRLIEEFHGPIGPPKELVFSPTGRRLACLSGDRSLRIWNLGTSLSAQQSE